MIAPNRDRAIYLAGTIGAQVLDDLCPDCQSPQIQATKQEMPFCAVCVERKLREMQERETGLRKTLGIQEKHWIGNELFVTPIAEPIKEVPLAPAPQQHVDWGPMLRRKQSGERLI